eukprot:655531-Rhodomonas_salina.2
MAYASPGHRRASSQDDARERHLRLDLVESRAIIHPRQYKCSPRGQVETGSIRTGPARPCKGPAR